MTIKKEQILALGKQGKSYTEIQEITGASKGTISYHLGDGQKVKTYARTVARRASHPLVSKIEHFRLTSKPPYIKPKNKEIRTEEEWAKRRFYLKLRQFHMTKERKKEKNYPKVSDLTFTPQDVIDKSNSICYLTGRPIDFLKSSEYELDHILARFLGGDNSLQNCGVACTEANRAKGHLSIEQFFQLCIDVVKHNNLKIN